MKKKGNLFKSVIFVLVFLLTGVSVFFASESFASYVTYYEQQAQANVAAPVISAENGSLIRTSNKGEIFQYDSSAFNGSIIEFDDIQPNDVIDAFFSINNYVGTTVNEVRMKVTLSVLIYLKRLTTDGDIEEYYVVGNTFLVSSDNLDEQVDMDGSNFSFYYSDAGLTDNMGDYTNMPLTLKYKEPKVPAGQEVAEEDLYENNYQNDDYVDFSMNETLDDILDYENGKNVAYSGNVTNGYYHHVGFIFEPGIGAKQRAFLLKITLPNQTTSGKDYATGRLMINISINAEQIL